MPKFRGNLHSIVFRPGALLDPISERTSRPRITEHQVAKVSLERYFYLLDTAGIKLDEAELELLKRLVKEGATSNLEKVKSLYGAVADAGNIDLARRIQKMSPVELVSLVDALERIII